MQQNPLLLGQWRRHPHRNGDLPVLGELDRVIGVVDQDLTETQRVAHQPVRHVGRHGYGQFQPLARDLLSHQISDIIKHMTQFEVGLLDPQLAGINLGKIENVVDQPQQMLTGTLNFHQVVALERRWFGLQGQVGHAEDSVHRRANLVAHIGQKRRLGLRRHLGPFAGFVQLRGAFRHEFLQVVAVAVQLRAEALLFGDVVLDCGVMGDPPVQLADRGNGSPLDILAPVLALVIEFAFPDPALGERIPQRRIGGRRGLARM